MRKGDNYLDTHRKKTPQSFLGRFALISFCVIPVVGTCIGSPEYCNPSYIKFQIDVIFLKWPGGSETSIKSSSFSL